MGLDVYAVRLNLGALFGAIVEHRGASGPQPSIPDCLWRSVEVARLGPFFEHFREKCEGFSDFCDFTFKKSPSQGLDFLYNNFLCVV